MEFSSIPANGSSISIKDAGTGKTYNFVFTNDPASVTGADNYAVDLSNGIVSISDFTRAFAAKIKEVMPSAGRFSADGDKISIVQSTAGSALEINASKTLSCLQSAANPLPSTGIRLEFLQFLRLIRTSKTVPVLTSTALSCRLTRGRRWNWTVSNISSPAVIPLIRLFRAIVSASISPKPSFSLPVLRLTLPKWSAFWAALSIQMPMSRLALSPAVSVWKSCPLLGREH